MDFVAEKILRSRLRSQSVTLRNSLATQPRELTSPRRQEAFEIVVRRMKCGGKLISEARLMDMKMGSMIYGHFFLLFVSGNPFDMLCGLIKEISPSHTKNYY